MWVSTRYIFPCSNPNCETGLKVFKYGRFLLQDIVIAKKNF
jgi:hypothetical protein